MKSRSLFLSSMQKEDKLKFSKLVLSNLKDLSQEYPDFYRWYWFKVISGIEDGDREIITLLKDNEIAGISILKKSEKKICTMRVNKKFQGNGYGKELFNLSFDVLETEKPIITVSEYRMFEFRRIFNYYGFKLEDVGNNYYAERINELAFNGVLDRNKKEARVEII